MKKSLFEYMLLVYLLSVYGCSREADQLPDANGSGPVVSGGLTTESPSKSPVDQPPKVLLIQNKALQVGKVQSSIKWTDVDKFWTGDITLRTEARYTFTYGFPFGFVDKGVRQIPHPIPGRIMLILDPPIVLSVAVDTSSIQQFLDAGFFRTAKYSEQMKLAAVKRLTEAAGKKATEDLKSPEAYNLARACIRDIFLDTMELQNGASEKRKWSDKVDVYYTSEIDQKTGMPMENTTIRP